MLSCADAEQDTVGKLSCQVGHQGCYVRCEQHTLHVVYVRMCLISELVCGVANTFM